MADIMKKQYYICTDSSCDLPPYYYDEPLFRVVALTFEVNGTEYYNRPDGGISSRELCEMMRGGATPRTSQITPARWCEEFEPMLDEGADILLLGFSSGLSGSTGAAVVAANLLTEKYPEQKIIAVDTLAASLGQGMLVHLVLKKRSEGASLEEAAEYARSIVQKICHYFTVDDLVYLLRGGRVSRTSAALGSILGIKPILNVDAEGRLIPIAKVRGRKASLEALLKKMTAKLKNNPAPEIVFISHADCEDEANNMADEVKKRFGAKETLIHSIGPVITAHAGPGTMAIFFMAESRNE